MDRLTRALAVVSLELADHRAEVARVHEAYRAAMVRHGLFRGTVALITSYATEWLTVNVPPGSQAPLIVAAPLEHSPFESD